MTTLPGQSGHPTLADDLDADRLRYRHSRILGVISVLRGRVAQCTGHGPIPEPLLQALRDFERERLRVEHDLAHR